MLTDRLSRRGFIGGTAAALGASSFATRGARAAEATEIRALLITGGPTYPKYWEKIVQDFTKKSGISVKYDLLEFTPLTTKTVTLGAARSDLYDVFSTHTAQIGSFFNYFAPLNEYFSADELKDFYEVGVKYLVDPKNNHLAAIPRNMDARTQYYRKDIYDEHNLKPAATWDELVSVSEKVTGNGHYGLVVPGQGDPAQRTFSDFLWQAGGEWVDEHNKPSFNSAEGIKALTFHRDLIQKYKVVPPDAVSYQWNENSSEFSSGSGFCHLRLARRFCELSQSRYVQDCRQVVDSALRARQDRDLLRDLACHGAQQYVQEKGRGGRVHQVHGEP